jgi:hypothetical protein
VVHYVHGEHVSTTGLVSGNWRPIDEVLHQQRACIDLHGSPQVDVSAVDVLESAQVIVETKNADESGVGFVTSAKRLSHARRWLPLKTSRWFPNH